MNKLIKNIDFHAVAISLILMVVYNLIITSISFALRVPISGLIFPISVLLSLITTLWSHRRNKDVLIASSLAILLVIFISVVAASLLFDYSWDGQWYHQDIIIGLMQGWNPFYGDLKFDALNTSLCVNHYARAIETVAACIGKFTGNVESGKSIEFTMFISGVILFYEFLGFYFKSFSKKKKIFISLIFNSCPVVMTQFFTYHTDWSIYILPLILVCLLIISEKNRTKVNYFTVASIILFLISTKFNYFFWICFLLFFYCIYLIISKKFNYFFKMASLFIVSIFIGFFVISYQPYITNYRDHGHIFFPLMGYDSSYNEQANTFPNLQGLNRFEQVFISYTSFAEHFSFKRVDLKSVFSLKIKPQNFTDLGFYDTRIGGFGWLFTWIFLFSSVLYLFVLRREHKHRHVYLGIILILLSTPFILPFGWWARYVPFFYLVPLIMILYTENWQERYLNLIRKILYGFIVLNISILLFSQAILLYSSENVRFKLIRTLKASNKTYDVDFGSFKSFKEKFNMNDIKYNEVHADTVNYFVVLGEIKFKKSQLEMIYTHPGVKFISLPDNKNSNQNNK